MATARQFSAAVLRHLEAKHPEDAFKATFVNGYWRGPRFSLRRQAELRKACLLTGVDPASIGMPEPPQTRAMQYKPPKGHKQQRLYAEKQAAIQKNLADMPEKIRKWKEASDLAKEKEKNRSSLPF
ncbi:hypothetical protein H4R18_003370 [Coemansia javaensis]|uniref:Large ribosomal subunit protein mL59 domain-containing protein n=1 Tax=Coemansia javaensis TaxID=2761396 RepID=A0A9W8H919_9FUNG|nr:hypothetical protein H4R18_003370 [Coemansia javaensis]